MIERWKHKLPTREKIFASRFFKPLAPLFDKPEYWSFKRDKVALSVAIGLFCGMLPAPTQFAFALLIAYFTRTNLPVALFSTLYTNPLTLIPLYVAAYKLGGLLLTGHTPAGDLVMPALGEPGFWADAGRWALQFGKPLTVGVLVMGITFAVCGYILVQLIWRSNVRRKQEKRRQRLSAKNTPANR
ncbi:hypothetical protein PL75_06740 [Neisseria arctica]|uniref:DUF2062 domain-containing protein n=1 Tax=Neisseria arctica TaxID=1470200 RepID=A0A0J0YRN1_9NEIS|nr:DUF2062 domain-containing protein [Neisseria arctica]KLT72767.1 hypothetical protein PL75_06740 [Neisseria arctica]UOO87265.1 DUF2062 domain-containing protein [Neisseria arctica]